MSSPQSQQATLRLAQAPLKQAYRTNPSSALVTLRAHGTLSSTSISCNITNSAAIASAHHQAKSQASTNTRTAGLHPMAGGTSLDLCSGDMLLEALVGCAGVTLKAVATTLGVPLDGGEVTAEADMDWRGTLGVDRDAPVGFTAIRLGFELKMREGAEGVSEADLETLGRMTERYCVVLQTIARRPELTVRMQGGTAGAAWEGRVGRNAH